MYIFIHVIYSIFFVLKIITCSIYKLLLQLITERDNYKHTRTRIACVRMYNVTSVDVMYEPISYNHYVNYD